MSHIHYKFSSKLSYDTLIFDGPHVTVRELKRRIMSKEKLRSGVCDLQISNAQSKEEYVEDEILISKGTSVIVKRIPVFKVKSSTNSKTRNFELSDIRRQSSGFGGINSMSNLAFAELSEEEKLKVLMKQSPYNVSSYNMKHDAGLPASYICFRCGNPGHHIRNCPIDKSSDAPLRLKKSTGIPRSFMVQVDDPNIKGAMLTKSGHYAVPAINAKAYAIGKKERPPFLPQEQPIVEEEDPIPTELLCLICHELLTDAVVIPCCGNSYCDECIRNALLESDEHVCPTCQESNVSPDSLIANKCLRQAVNKFEKERGQRKIKRRCDTPQSKSLDKKPAPVSAQPPVTMQRQPKKPHQAANCQQRDPAEKICDDSADAGLSALVANKDATTAASQVSDTAAEEQPKMFSLTAHQSSNPAQGQHWPSTHRETSVTSSSSSSSSSFPNGGWSNPNPSYPSTTPSYPSVPPPLIPSPYFHTYPPAYPPATPMWNQVPQGASIPSLCSSTKEWSGHQRRNERSPHRGPTHRCSPSPSKPSKSSQCDSSSRFRSRSRSPSKSRRHSPYSHHRRSETRPHSPYYNSYRYKRSPAPSSSSSSRVNSRSRSRSPSDHNKSHRCWHPGNQHSPASLLYRPSQDRGLLSSECMNRSRNVKTVEKEECKRKSTHDDTKAGKRLRAQVEELEEGELLSSDESESEWKKKETKQQRKRKAAPELEEREPNKHKKSKG